MIETGPRIEREHEPYADPPETGKPTDEQIDKAVEQTFPASDPFSVHSEKEAPENPGLNDKRVPNSGTSDGSEPL